MGICASVSHFRATFAPLSRCHFRALHRPSHLDSPAAHQVRAFASTVKSPAFADAEPDASALAAHQLNLSQ
eukprot:4085416-Pleurochrysis_carterae.AAC.1